MRRPLTACAVWLGLLLSLFPVAAQEDQAALLRAALDQLDASPFSGEVGDAYEELHGRAHRLGDQALTAEALDRLVARVEELNAGDDETLAQVLDDMSVRARAVGDLRGARRLARRGLELREALHGPVHLDVSTSANHLAIAVELLGEVEQALALYDRAVAIRDELGEGDSLAASALLNNRAIALYKLTRYEESLDSFRRSLVIKEQLLPPDDTLLAQTLDNMGTLKQLMGRPSEARPLHERALSILEQAHGADSPALTTALSNLAHLLKGLGDLPAALALAERSVRLLEAQHGPHDQRLAVPLENLSQLHDLLGDDAQALALARRVVQIQERHLPPVHAELARGLALLAGALMDVGAVDEAHTLYLRCVDVERQLQSGAHRGLLTALSGLAACEHRLGRRQEALELYREQQELIAGGLGDDHPLMVYALQGEADSLVSLDQLEAAWPVMRRAHDLALLRLGADNDATIGLARGLVVLALDRGDLEAARERVAALEARRERLPALLAGLTEAEALDYLQDQSGSLAAQLSVHEALGDVPAAYRTVLASKGRVARLAYGVRGAARARLDDETRALAERLQELQAELARRALAAGQAGAPSPDGEDAEALVAERDRVDRELRRRLWSGPGDALTAADLAAALPADGALVDLLVASRWVPGRDQATGARTRGAWSELRVDAWVLRPGDDRPRHVPLGFLAPLQQALDEHRGQLIGEGTARGRSVGRPGRRPAQQGALERLLWQPLAPLLDGAATVFVSPDGPLGGLPFETLRGADGRFLIESRGFVYLSDAGGLLDGGERAWSPDTTDLLALGAVDYAAGASAAGAARWAPLPATGDEVQALVAHHARVAPGARRTTLVGAEASEGALLQHLAGHELVHLATHGAFEAEGLTGALARELPGLRSGLVLAGVDGRPPDGGDGLLTAAEVAVADLSGVELVVLSACETGLGRATAGEGLLGLRRAFHIAGAETVVSSLWSVPDEATARLMASFYEHLLVDGLGRHAALRQAQLELLESRRRERGEDDPRSWGAFVLSGAWR